MRPPKSLRTWVLAGQSNMEGGAPLVDSRYRTPDDEVWSLSSAGEWVPAADPLHEPARSFTPIHLELMRPTLPAEIREADQALLVEWLATRNVWGTGPGMPFARALVEADGSPVGLIPAAHGGTSLAQWDPAEAHRRGASLYGSLLERVRLARETIDAQLAGLLWFQGEEDATSGVAAASTYAKRLDGFLHQVRRDLEQPDLQIIVVQLGRAAGPSQIPEAWNLIREAQRTAGARVTRAVCVPAIDLPLCQAIHTSARGLERLGRRMARVALGESPLDLASIERHGGPTEASQRIRVRCAGVSGRLRGDGIIRGFAVHAEDGTPHPIATVYDAQIAEDDPHAIDVFINGLPPASAPARPSRISYGWDSDPVCTVTDEADMALPAFAPQFITGPVRATAE
jgi:sialate O-acetylesterase